MKDSPGHDEPAPGRPRWIVTAFCALCLLAIWYGFFLSNARYYDLVPTYFAAELWLDGQAQAVYQPEIWPALDQGDPAWRSTITKHGYPGFKNSYVYHPFYLALWLPIAGLLPLHLFNALFVLLNAAALAFIVADVLERIGRRIDGLQIPATLLLGCTYPVTYSVQLGQNVLICLAAVLIAFRALEKDRRSAAYPLLLLTAAAKPWFILLLGVLPFMGRWRDALWLGVLYGAGFVALPLLTLPRPMVGDWTVVLDRLPDVSILAYNNVSLRAFIHRALDPNWTDHLLSWQPLAVPARGHTVELIAIGVLALVCLAALLRRRTQGLLWLACPPLILIPLGVVWDHYIVMAIPALLVGLFGVHDSRLRALFMIAAASFALPAPRIVSWLASREFHALIPLVLALPFASVITATLALLWSRSPAGDEPVGRDRGQPRSHAALTGVALVIALATAACRPGGLTDSASEDAKESGPRRPDILLVVLDTVGSAHTSAYGYPRDTTPVLDSLLADATRYTRAYSTSCWTVPSHASMFTGLYPVAHHATQENWTLAPGHDTLAEILSGNGYETVAVVANPMLSEQRGFSQGFSSYVEAWRPRYRQSLSGRQQTRDEVAVQLVRDALRSRSSDRPLFLFVNFIGAHSPYDSCGEFCERYASPDGGKNVGSNLYANYIDKPFSQAEVTHLRDLYDAEVRQVDHLLGNMIETFRERDLWDDSLVIITSDHGENFGYQGHVGHVFTLNDATTRVPLIVRAPGGRRNPSDRAEPVQLTDVFSTVLAAADLDAEAHDAQGFNLLSPLPDDREVLLEYYRPLQAIGLILAAGNDQQRALIKPHNRALRGIVADRWKFIEADDGTRALYDLNGDPEELANLAGTPQQAAREQRLREQLAALRETYAATDVEPAAGTQVDEPTRRALEAIGYLE